MDEIPSTVNGLSFNSMHRKGIIFENHRITNTPQLKEFTLFQNLATELRLQIWNHAIADIEPRIVEVVFERTPLAAIPTSPTTTPALFHASEEVRREIKKTYTRLCIDQDFTGAIINYSKDILFFNTEFLTRASVTQAKPARWMKLCRNLALTQGCLSRLLPNLGHDSGFLAQFASLDQLSMVVDSKLPPLSCTGQTVAYGMGSLRFGAVCRYDTGDDSNLVNMMTNMIFHNSNIKGGNIVAVSRRSSPTDELMKSSESISQLHIQNTPEGTPVCFFGNDSNRTDHGEHTCAPLTLPPDIRGNPSFGSLDALSEANLRVKCMGEYICEFFSESFLVERWEKEGVLPAGSTTSREIRETLATMHPAFGRIFSRHGWL